MRLMIFAKYPETGHVKTRLTPALSAEDAAALYRAFLLDAVVSFTTIDEIEPVLYMSAEREIAPMRKLLAAEQIGAGIDIRAQRGDGLGERLEYAFADAFADECRSACAVGTDHPTLPIGIIDEARDALGAADVVIGPAYDGGYYLIAMKAHHPELFQGMPYSTANLRQVTEKKALQLWLEVTMLEPWYDVDDPETLATMWEDRDLLRPSGYTAAEVTRLADAIADVAKQHRFDPEKP